MKNSMRELIAHAATQLKLDGIPEELQKEILARLGEVFGNDLCLTYSTCSLRSTDSL